MTSDRDFVFATMRNIGRTAALNLRDTAASLTNAEILAQAAYIPDFDKSKNYTNAPVGTPVAHNGKVYKLKIPHNPSDYGYNTPDENATMWEEIAE